MEDTSYVVESLSMHKCYTSIYLNAVYANVVELCFTRLVLVSPGRSEKQYTTNSTQYTTNSTFLIISTHFAVGEVIDLLTDVVDIGFRFIVCSTTSDVVVGFRQSDDGAFQPDKQRVCQCGVVCLRVVAGYLIHPALKGARRNHFTKCRIYFRDLGFPYT